MEYCEMIFLIILYYINEQIQLYDNNIAKIPLTNTGRVRKFVKEMLFYNKIVKSSSENLKDIRN